MAYISKVKIIQLIQISKSINEPCQSLFIGIINEGINLKKNVKIPLPIQLFFWQAYVSQINLGGNF
jgi:hypothetical protein